MTDGKAEFLKQARALPDDELRRHAWIATANGPFDPEDGSFTTICELVRRERNIAPLHFTFHEITAERFDDMLGAVPPAIHDDSGFLLGEAISSRKCSVTNRECATFRAFLNRNGEFWESDVPLTVAEYRKGGFDL